MLVRATISGAERKCGTVKAIRRSNPRSASHSSMMPTLVPVREISRCGSATYSSNPSGFFTAGWSARTTQTIRSSNSFSIWN